VGGACVRNSVARLGTRVKASSRLGMLRRIMKQTLPRTNSLTGSQKKTYKLTMVHNGAVRVKTEEKSFVKVPRAKVHPP